MTTFTNRSYNHFGTKLLVSGERDKKECSITRITAADSSIDLFDMLPLSIVLDIGERIDAQMSREAREDKRDEAIAVFGVLCGMAA